MTTIALLSDIHGNPIALDAVLEDIQQQGGADQYWILGDLAAIGHDPVGTLEKLARLPNATFVRGNTDRYLVTGERPGPTIEQCSSNRWSIAPCCRTARACCASMLHRDETLLQGCIQKRPRRACAA